MNENIKYLDHKVVMNLINSIPGNRDKLIFHLIYAYGLRVTELINITLSDIDIENRTVKIVPLKRKDKNKQQFPLSENSIELINKWLSERPKCDCPNLIVTRYSKGGIVIFKPISAVNIFKRFRKYATAVGIDQRFKHPHTLRHSIAVSMANEGHDIYFAKEFLRHTTVKSTEVYYNIANAKRTAKAVELHSALGL